MSLPTDLNTNQIKKADGAEVEFTHRRQEGTLHEYLQVGEAPGQPHRLRIQHEETGSGTSRVRRTLVRFDKSQQGQTDTTKTITCSAYLYLVIPVGNINDYQLAKDTLAELMSFMASTGADTTIKFDCTGTGASAAINGTL